MLVMLTKVMQTMQTMKLFKSELCRLFRILIIYLCIFGFYAGNNVDASAYSMLIEIYFRVGYL